MDEIDETILRRLTLARYLFTEARSISSEDRTLLQFAAINLLQDSIEIFLLSAADYLNANLQQKTPFERYIDLINDKMPTTDLPYRKRLIEINKVRVLSKHEGVRPNREELLDYIVTARNFFEEASRAIFQRDFWSFSLIDLLEEGDIKGVLEAAEGSLHLRRFDECLIECRKALFLAFEANYSIYPFREGNSYSLLRALCKAPHYSMSQSYIEKNVRDPFDYIVLDHAHLDSEIVKLGVSPNIFWNVWRLTPQVCRLEPSGDWLVKNEPEKFSVQGLAERSNYVHEASIDLMLAKQRNQKSTKWIRNDTDYVVNPKAGAPLFEKADDTLVPIEYVPLHCKELSVKYSTPALNGDLSFWYVFQMFGTGDDDDFKVLSGYLRFADVEQKA